MWKGKKVKHILSFERDTTSYSESRFRQNVGIDTHIVFAPRLESIYLYLFKSFWDVQWREKVLVSIVVLNKGKFSN